MNRPGKWKVELVLHGKMAAGGYMYVYGLVDYPGVSVTDTRRSRKHDTVRTVIYDDREFELVQDAIDAWTADVEENDGL